MADDDAEMMRKLAELEAGQMAPTAPHERDVEITCRVCGETKNPSKYEIYDGSEICYACSAKRSKRREILQHTIPGAAAFITTVYFAHSGGGCGPDSLPGCLLFTSAAVAAIVFFLLYAVLAD